jgi:hypothetical protein
MKIERATDAGTAVLNLVLEYSCTGCIDGTGWISNFERTNENLDCREMVLRTRSYVTKWQNCIRPCGKVQLKSLVLTMRSDFLTGGVCKVVGYYT